MSLLQQFEAAAEDIKTLTKRPTNEEFLELYALFKQATVGDCNTPKPNMFDMKAKAKWEAWKSKKEISKEVAMQAYIDYVKYLLEKYK